MKTYLICIAVLAIFPIPNGNALVDVAVQVFKMAASSESLKEMTKIIDKNAATLQLTPRKVNNEMDRLITYYREIDNFKANGAYIDRQYSKLRMYGVNPHIRNTTVIAFAESCVSHDRHAIPFILNSIFNLITFPITNNANLFELLIQDVRTKEDELALCGRNKSNQQEVYILYNIVVMYMLKGYALMLHSYAILEKHGRGSFQAEIETTHKEAVNHLAEIRNAALTVLKKASRDVRPCDPTTNKEGETYTQLKWLFTATVMHNAYLEEDAHCKKCEKVPAGTTFLSGYNYGDHQCYGEVTFCFYEDFSSVYCAATEPYRRFNGFPKWKNWIMASLPARGNVDNCVETPMTSLSGRHAWENRIPGLSSLMDVCSYCICYCDAKLDPDTVRAFSLRVAEARTDENRVVTGARIIEKNQIFHIQIQDGVLRPNGTVDRSTLEWVPVDNIHFKPGRKSSDYFTIDRNNHHVFFDKLIAPNGRALTGLAFRGDGECCGVKIKVQHSLVDVAAGKVESGTDQWLLNDVKRETSDLFWEIEPHIPTLGKDKNVVHLNEKAYMQFRQTDWIKDAAQIAIPFIDIQPVVLHPPVLLSGAGLYYKGQKGYGGFIGLKLVTYDHGEFISKDTIDVDIDE